MTKLLVSKNTEALVLSTIWSMGAESLDPRTYAGLEVAIMEMINTRSIDLPQLSEELKVISGCKVHKDKCAANTPLPYIPMPCNCLYIKD